MRRRKAIRSVARADGASQSPTKSPISAESGEEVKSGHSVSGMRAKSRSAILQMVVGHDRSGQAARVYSPALQHAIESSRQFIKIFPSFALYRIHALLECFTPLHHHWPMKEFTVAPDPENPLLTRNVAGIDQDGRPI